MNQALNNFDIAGQLQAASVAVMEMQMQGRHVLGYHFNGREPVLLVDGQPNNGLIGATSVREPDGKGGFLRRFTSKAFDVRVEWQVHEVGTSAEAHDGR
jgi:hypothetical protein